MAEEGIVRKLDRLGRVVIPKEIRKLLNVDAGDELIIAKRDNWVMISKYSSRCLFCNKSEGIMLYKGVYICQDCMDKIKNGLGKGVDNKKYAEGIR